jgi:hypothetical protein
MRARPCLSCILVRLQHGSAPNACPPSLPCTQVKGVKNARLAMVSFLGFLVVHTNMLLLLLLRRSRR